jgi:DNA-binding winged helix-turn-helix (wHTH) protein
MLLQDNHLYEFKPFLLDAGRIPLKDGVTVKLTPKAFETLLVLVQHGVQVVEKDQLLKRFGPIALLRKAASRATFTSYGKH